MPQKQSPKSRSQRSVRSVGSVGSDRSHQPQHIPVVFTRPWHPLTPEQRRAIFSSWTRDDDRFRALWDQLSDEFEAALLSMLNTPGDAEGVQRHIGELRAIVGLKATILNMQQPDSAAAHKFA